MKKLIPALAMLIVSALVMSSASYAWFTMNKSVSANGMDLTVQAPENLQISSSENGTYASTATFTDGTATLAPASSSDGLTFGAYLGSAALTSTDTTEIAKIIEVTGGTYTVETSAKTYNAYKDVDIWVKSVNAVNELNCEIAVSAKDGSTTSNIYKAARVAILNGGKTAAGLTGGHIYQDETAVATEVFKKDTTWSVIARPTANDLVTASKTTLAANTATHFVIRVWIEGQSPACVISNLLDTDKGGLKLTNFDVKVTFTVKDQA